MKDVYYYQNLSLDTVINNIKIYRLEEYYKETNSPKKIAYVTNTEPTSFKYFFEKREYFENGNLESLMKYNISGTPIDTAYYCYPSGSLKLITYRNPKRDNIVSNKSIEYLGYYDEAQNPLLLKGNGTIRFPIFTYLNTENHEEGTMSNSYKHGTWKGVINNYTFEEEYDNGNLIAGKTYTPNGNIISYTQDNIKVEPDYPGGMEALRRYIGLNYKFPAFAIENQVSGDVIVEFNVLTNGSISEIKVIKDLGYGTGEAAIHVLKNLNNLIPGTIRGIPFTSKWRIPINLNIQIR